MLNQLIDCCWGGGPSICLAARLVRATSIHLAQTVNLTDKTNRTRCRRNKTKKFQFILKNKKWWSCSGSKQHFTPHSTVSISDQFVHNVIEFAFFFYTKIARPSRTLRVYTSFVPISGQKPKWQKRIYRLSSGHFATDVTLVVRWWDRFIFDVHGNGPSHFCARSAAIPT